MGKRRQVDSKAKGAGVLLAIACCALSSTAAAAALDSKATSSLLAGHTWQLKKPRGPGNDYWSWSTDGSVCLRLGESTGKCADTGRWKLNGERVCYELTWWGAESGMKSACFRVVALEKDRYGALQDSGLNLFEFSVAK